jgi:hypothetical protein
MTARVGRTGKVNFPSLHLDRAAIGSDDAGQDLDKGALARAVGTQQRVNLARLHGEVDRAQGDDRAVALSYVPGGDEGSV